LNQWKATPFAQLIIDSKDGEWGESEEAGGLREAMVIRGTDFTELDNPGAEFPRRWVKSHIVDRKQLRPGDIILETAGGTSTQSTGRSALLRGSFFLNHPNTPVLCASFSRHLRLDKQKYSPRFIYYLLQLLYQTGYMAIFNIQHTGVSRFQFTAFKKHTDLRIPELPNQRKIGHPAFPTPSLGREIHARPGRKRAAGSWRCVSIAAPSFRGDAKASNPESRDSGSGANAPSRNDGVAIRRSRAAKPSWLFEN
jgi:hypothetical protein